MNAIDRAIGADLGGRAALVLGPDVPSPARHGRVTADVDVGIALVAFIEAGHRRLRFLGAWAVDEDTAAGVQPKAADADGGAVGRDAARRAL